MVQSTRSNATLSPYALRRRTPFSMFMSVDPELGTTVSTPVPVAFFRWSPKAYTLIRTLEPPSPASPSWRELLRSASACARRRCCCLIRFAVMPGLIIIFLPSCVAVDRSCVYRFCVHHQAWTRAKCRWCLRIAQQVNLNNRSKQSSAMAAPSGAWLRGNH